MCVLWNGVRGARTRFQWANDAARSFRGRFKDSLNIWGYLRLVTYTSYSHKALQSSLFPLHSHQLPPLPPMMLRYGVLQGLRHSAILSSNVAPKPLAYLRVASTLSRYPRVQRSSPTLVTIQRAQKKRNAASSVSGKPASPDIPHALENAKEEAKGLVSDVAKIIAAANFSKESHNYDGFVSTQYTSLRCNVID